METNNPQHTAYKTPTFIPAYNNCHQVTTLRQICQNVKQIISYWVRFKKNYPCIFITDSIGLAIQKIAITEKYRPIYEKQAKERQATSTGGANPQLTPKLAEAEKEKNRANNETNVKLSKLAGVGKETYRMGAKILNSDNEKLKQEVLSGEKSINAGYKELTGKKENQYI